MQKLNELVELAKNVLSPKDAFAGVDAKFEWTAKVNPTAILAIAEAFRELEQEKEAAEAKIQAERETSDIIMESLRQKEARVAELEAGPKFIANIKRMSELAESQGLVEKQEPDYTRFDCGCCGFETLTNYKACPECNHNHMRKTDLLTRSAPAINMAELVPREMVVEPFSRPIESQKMLEARAEGFNLCRAAILRNIEERVITPPAAPEVE